MVKEKIINNSILVTHLLWKIINLNSTKWDQIQLTCGFIKLHPRIQQCSIHQVLGHVIRQSLSDSGNRCLSCSCLYFRLINGVINFWSLLSTPLFHFSTVWGQILNLCRLVTGDIEAFSVGLNTLSNFNSPNLGVTPFLICLPKLNATRIESPVAVPCSLFVTLI